MHCLSTRAIWFRSGACVSAVLFVTLLAYQGHKMVATALFASVSNSLFVLNWYATVTQWLIGAGVVLLSDFENLNNAATIV